MLLIKTFLSGGLSFGHCCKKCRRKVVLNVELTQMRQKIDKNFQTIKMEVKL